MYRVFEALDELVQTLEQAYGVPMTSNCMVPRNEILGLLDDPVSYTHLTLPTNREV